MKRSISNNESPTLSRMRSAMLDIALDSLHGHGFFSMAALGGHAAAEVAHGSPLFPGHLEFSLLERDGRFDLAPFMKKLSSDFTAYGLDVSVSLKRKRSPAVLAPILGTPPHGIKAEIRVPGEPSLALALSLETSPSPLFSLLDPCLDRSKRFSCIPLPGFFAWNVCSLLSRHAADKGFARYWFHLSWCVENGVELPLDCLLHLLLHKGVVLEPWSAGKVVREKLHVQVCKLDLNALFSDMILNGALPERTREWSPEYFSGIVDSMKVTAAWQSPCRPDE